jgi:hypothetical protein
LTLLVNKLIRISSTGITSALGDNQVPGTVAGESEIDSSTLWGWLPSLTLPDNVAGYHADIKGAEIVTAVEEATDAGHHPHCITETGIGTRTTLSTGSGMRGEEERDGEWRRLENPISNIAHATTTGE